jgi:Protein of unknown function (DUF3108)
MGSPEQFNHRAVPVRRTPMLRRSVWRAAILGLLLAASGTVPAGADGRLKGHYTASLAGIPIGKGSWIVDIRDHQYSAAAEGRVIGLMRAITRGDGTASAEGNIAAGRLEPSAFASHTGYNHSVSDVRMKLKTGAVTSLFAEPPVQPSPDRIPVTDAHHHGVVDPMSAALIGIPGEGELLSPDVCRRTLPIFDGYQRFDLALAFKRMDEARTARGYEGPVVVCTVNYRPIAGHRPARFAIRYLMEQRDMEIWFAPIAGTRVLAALRMYVPTLFGPAVLEATQFTATIAGSRADAGPADHQTR